MTYRVEVAPAAVRQLRKLDPSARRRIQAAVELLADQPRPSGAKKLVGGDREWRVRTGDYRIIYEIHDDVLLVLVIAVGHRRDIYQRHRPTDLAGLITARRLKTPGRRTSSPDERGAALPAGAPAPTDQASTRP
jgi:mRNA interferase RelE/StbE